MDARRDGRRDAPAGDGTVTVGGTADHAAAGAARQQGGARSNEPTAPSFALAGRARGRRCPRMVVVDLDRAPVLIDGETAAEPPCDDGAADPWASGREAARLRSLEGRGTVLVLVTAAGEPEARQAAAAWGIRPIILSDVVAGGAAGALGGAGPEAVDPADPLSLAARRAEKLAQLCDGQHLGFQEICVIAALPRDSGLVMEAGWALALQDAGAASCRAADEVFAARAEGGLVAALDRVLERVP